MAIEINTVEEYLGINNWVDKGTSDTPLDVVLTADLDFSGIEDFVSVGGADYYMNFDGQGHTIKNIVTNQTANIRIIQLGDNSSVRNINFENNHITVPNNSYNFIAIDIGRYGVINNCVWKNNNYIYSSNARVFWISRDGYINKCGAGGNIISPGDITVIGTGFWYTSTSGGHSSGEIRNSYVTANLNAAGNINIFYGSTIINSFSRSKITAAKDVSFGPNFDETCYYCYSANEVSNATGDVYGLNNRANYSCFYDNILLESAVDTANGQPTENLKSVEWLRSQGWAV